MLSAMAWAAAAALDGWAVSIAISSTQPLAFGRFVAGSGGTVSVSPNGARSAGGGVLLLSSGGGSAAQFSVSGDPLASYSITLPANGTVALADGANTMPVNGFSSSPSSPGLLSLGGAQTLFVGATLSVAAEQPAGSYSASFGVLVNYN